MGRALWDFIMLLSMTCSLEFMMCLCLEYSTYCFWNMLTLGSWNQQKVKPWIMGNYCNPTLFWMKHQLESRLLGEIPISSDMQMTWPLWQKAKVKVKSHSCVWLFATPWTVVCQAPLSMELSRQEYWSGLPFPSPGDRPNPGVEFESPTLQADSTIWAMRESWLKTQHSEN